MAAVSVRLVRMKSRLVATALSGTQTMPLRLTTILMLMLLTVFWPPVISLLSVRILLTRSSRALTNSRPTPTLTSQPISAALSLSPSKLSCLRVTRSLSMSTRPCMTWDSRRTWTFRVGSSILMELTQMRNGTLLTWSTSRMAPWLLSRPQLPSSSPLSLLLHSESKWRHSERLSWLWALKWADCYSLHLTSQA